MPRLNLTEPIVEINGNSLSIVDWQVIEAEQVNPFGVDGAGDPLVLAERREPERVSVLVPYSPIAYEKVFPVDPFVIYEESDRDWLEFFGLMRERAVFPQLGDEMEYRDIYCVKRYRITWMDTNQRGINIDATLIHGRFNNVYSPVP